MMLLGFTIQVFDAGALTLGSPIASSAGSQSGRIARPRRQGCSALLLPLQVEGPPAPLPLGFQRLISESYQRRGQRLDPRLCFSLCS
jgi:hypothetical protein